MKKGTRITSIFLALLFGLALVLGLLWAFWQPAQADPGVLYAAPTASGNADCSTWIDACDLQTALANAVSGDQIWVQMGIHKPTITADRTVNFPLQPGVEVYGGFAGDEDDLSERDWKSNLTVLSGDIDSNDLADPTGVVTVSTTIVGDNSYHVVTAGSGITESARLDGFIITAGQADGTTPNDRGGGIYNLAGDPVLANTLLSGNLADSQGGGMYNEGLYGNGSNPTLMDVTFSGNSASSGGGLADYYFSSPTLTDVTFSNNSAENDGGGMYNRQDANPSLTDCLFRDNTAAAGGGMFNDIWANPNLIQVIFNHNTASSAGGGMASFNSAHPALDGVTFQNNTAVNGGGMWTYYNAHSYNFKNTRFVGNSATNGGGLYSQAAPYDSHVIINAVFLDNTASNYGGAIYSDRSVIALTNATLQGNSAGVRGGAFYNYNQGDSNMSNVILWDNNAPAAPEIYNEDSSNQISYCLVAGSGGSGAGWNTSLGTDSGGNLDSDPNFLDAASGDLRLQPGSPAIDAGDNSAVPAGITTDLDGNPRFVDDPSAPNTGSGSPPIVDMGAYEVSSPAVTLEKEVYPATVEPGDPITFTLVLTNSGTSSATQVVLTDTLPAYLTDRSVIWSGLSITDSGYSPAYVWDVQDLEPGAGGVITITGILSTPLTSDVYTNTAVIAFDAVSDRLSLTEEVTYTVSNLAPTFTSTPLTTATQGSLYTYAVTTEDMNGDVVTITAPTIPGWLLLTDHGNGTATLSGTPTRADIGDHAVTLLVTDTGGLTAPQNFTISVTGCVYLPLVLRSTP